MGRKKHRVCLPDIQSPTPRDGHSTFPFPNTQIKSVLMR